MSLGSVVDPCEMTKSAQSWKQASFGLAGGITFGLSRSICLPYIKALGKHNKGDVSANTHAAELNPRIVPSRLSSSNPFTQHLIQIVAMLLFEVRHCLSFRYDGPNAAFTGSLRVECWSNRFWQVLYRRGGMVQRSSGSDCFDFCLSDSGMHLFDVRAVKQHRKDDR